MSDIDDTQTACDDGTCGLCRTCAPAGLPTLDEIMDLVHVLQTYPRADDSETVVRDAIERLYSAARLAVEAQQDRERLDWLDTQREPVSRDGETLECYAWGVYGQNLDVRNAIDAARAERPTGGTE